MTVLASPSMLARAEIITRLRNRLRAARDDVRGIILFGSFARREPWHDVDALVVVESLPVSPVEYNRQVAALSQAVGWPPTVDLLLYTQSDFHLNLAHHTPLFLDIAFDGQVICDTGEIVRALETTRAEVTTLGIRRTPTGGWCFPAILVCFGAFERTHRVAELLRAELGQQPISQWEDALETLAAASANLEPDVSRARYPGEREGTVWEPAKHYAESQATAALADARRPLAIARDFVGWWFN